jgi:phospholipid/cholesterol/gamma-HCH transport system permease protein
LTPCLEFNFDPRRPAPYVRSVPNETTLPSPSTDDTETALLWRSPLPRALRRLFQHKVVRFFVAWREMGAFTLIALGVVFTKFNVAKSVMRPLLLQQIVRSGVTLLPMTSFLALALGLLIIGQTMSVLTRVGAQGFLGTVLVTVVVRELAPLLTAVLVLCRTGAATVVELGTARALGEVEALEVLGIDPIHYFVFPRLVGMAVGTFALTVYLVIGAILSGIVWAFVQGLPLSFTDYFRQLAAALTAFDFLLLAFKSLGFGIAIAVTTCYCGLAQPISFGQVSTVTVRAVGQSIIFCGLLDVAFLAIYLFL